MSLKVRGAAWGAWPLAVIVLLIVGLLMAGVGIGLALWPALNGKEDVKIEAPGGVSDGASAGAPANTPAVPRFAAFVTQQEWVADGEPQAEVPRAAEGIRRLADALDEVAATEGTTDAVSDRVAAISDLADRIEQVPSGGERASAARSAFVLAAEAITDVQRRRFPHLERAATEVRRAARRVEARAALETQADAVQRFFDRTSDILLAMAR